MTRLPFRIFPVRHHSPVAARHLVAVMREDPPSHVLIEGPADASRYIPDIAEPDTVPPVSLLYFVRGRAYSSFPMAAFSPEYQAMRAARELGIEASFCDMPYKLAVPGADDEERRKAGEATGEAEGPVRIERSPLDVTWETEIELGAPDVSTYLEAAGRFGHTGRTTSRRDRAREAYMHKVASNLAASGVAPERILIVCGAAHAPALTEGDVDTALLEDLENLGEAEIYLVPYSFRRFSSVLGYGAGTSYPHFYQALWDAGGRVEEAVCQMLTEVCRDLAGAGFEASLADTIDAMMLARHLAALRGKPAPGPEELVQAVESCLTRGHYGRAAEAVTQRLVGDRMGRVTPGADKAPLAREFYAFINHPQRAELLPLTDLPASRLLDLRRPLQHEVSRFLHRLVFLRAGYAEMDDALLALVRNLGVPEEQQEDATVCLNTISRVQSKACETWRLRWSAQLDSALADASGLGGTIEDAARASAETKLKAVTHLIEAVALYLEVGRAGLDRMVLPCLTRVEDLARRSTQLTALVNAAEEVLTALRYGAGFASEERTRELAAVLAGRAVSLWASCPRVPDSETRQVAQALEQLAALRHHLPGPVARAIVSLFGTAARSHALQPELAGICAAIAFRGHMLSPLAIVSELLDRLVAENSMTSGAFYLSGLLSHSREYLLATTEATDALRDFVMRLPEPRFLALLPVLRKGFQLGSSSEIRYFMALLAGTPGEPARPPSPVTRRINRRVEAATFGVLGRWLSHADAV